VKPTLVIFLFYYKMSVIDEPGPTSTKRSQLSFGCRLVEVSQKNTQMRGRWSCFGMGLFFEGLLRLNFECRQHGGGSSVGFAVEMTVFSWFRSRRTDYQV
jgi:hypothetical protein